MQAMGSRKICGRVEYSPMVLRYIRGRGWERKGIGSEARSCLSSFHTAAKLSSNHEVANEPLFFLFFCSFE